MSLHVVHYRNTDKSSCLSFSQIASLYLVKGSGDNQEVGELWGLFHIFDLPPHIVLVGGKILSAEEGRFHLKASKIYDILTGKLTSSKLIQSCSKFSSGFMGKIILFSLILLLAHSLFMWEIPRSPWQGSSNAAEADGLASTFSMCTSTG